MTTKMELILVAIVAFSFTVSAEITYWVVFWTRPEVPGWLDPIATPFLAGLVGVLITAGSIDLKNHIEEKKKRKFTITSFDNDYRKKWVLKELRKMQLHDIMALNEIDTLDKEK